VTEAAQETTHNAVRGWLALGPHSTFTPQILLSRCSKPSRGIPLDIRVLFAYTSHHHLILFFVPNIFLFILVFPRVRDSFTRRLRLEFSLPLQNFLLGKIFGHF
jgi:hypothetical protein